MDILTQEEIDMLLRPIEIHTSPDKINSINDLSNALIKTIKEKSFEFRESFFQGPHITISKIDLDQIYNKLTLEEPEAIVKIGNAELIPVHVCPHCKHYHSDGEIVQSYSQALPDRNFVIQHNKLGKSKIIRKWRTERQTVICLKCGKPFQPVIVFSQNSDCYTPYLCKLQLINDLDEWFAGTFHNAHESCRLFSSQTNTVKVEKSGKTSLYWDIFLNESVNGMKSAPAHLLTNILRYTPVEEIESMIEGKKHISVFSDFDFREYYHPLHYFNRQISHTV
ncbi:MAG: hypothetical protein OEZ34_00915 [Spirochaetia bacterium]|nr:hypothetical protein [Spirochaetia bacterium]